jgi:hypothetical protein
MKSMNIATAVTYIFGVQMISVIVRLWKILFDMVTIMLDYGYVEYDYIISHLI